MKRRSATPIPIPPWLLFRILWGILALLAILRVITLSTGISYLLELPILQQVPDSFLEVVWGLVIVAEGLAFLSPKLIPSCSGFIAGVNSFFAILYLYDLDGWHMVHAAPLLITAVCVVVVGIGMATTPRFKEKRDGA